jgi:thiamine-phosphate pyrophosphorylase
VPLIVNDDVELAAAIGAAGVHLARTTTTSRPHAHGSARAIIGVSCYDSLERARHFAAAGADYLAFGAFFPSPTKPHARRASLDLLRDARAFEKPLVAIGGITIDNASSLIEAGADGVAVISALFGAGRARRSAAFASLFGAMRS